MSGSLKGANYADQIRQMREAAAEQTDSKPLGGAATSTTSTSAHVGTAPADDKTSVGSNGAPRSAVEAPPTGAEQLEKRDARSTAERPEQQTTPSHDREQHSEVEEVQQPVAQVRRTYKKPGITVYPATEKQIAEMLYYFVMNGVEIPGKRGLSLFARAGIDELYHLFKDDMPTFLERMEKTVRATDTL